MSYNSARPKRAGEDYARTHHNNDFDGQPSKKPRFDVRNPSALAPDALEEDEVLEADVIGKRGQQVRRGAVNVDGYDSDSDNENFNNRADAKAKAQEAASKSKEEDENDMFADLEDEFKDGDDSEGDAGRKADKKKAVRFLDVDEIEGQIKDSKSGGHISADFSVGDQGMSKGKGRRREQSVESSSDSEVDDETRADVGEVDTELGAGSKKTHAPKVDAFNMIAEAEEGRFDAQGNFVRKAVDPDAVHDTWMEGVSKKEMRKAKEAHEKREQERRQRDLEDDAVPTAEVLKTLIPFLDSGETVLEALARYGKNKDKKPKWQQKRKVQKRNGANGDAEMSEADPTETERKQSIEAITAAADMLLTRGQAEVYDAEKELLMRQYRRETGEDWVEPSSRSPQNGRDVPASRLWMYRWSDARDGGEAHGPYDGVTMKAWNDAGYFGEGVEFQEEGGTDSWVRVADFV